MRERQTGGGGGETDRHTDHKRERVLLILTAYGVLRVKTETEETDTVRQTQRGTDREGEETTVSDHRETEADRHLIFNAQSTAKIGTNQRSSVTNRIHRSRHISLSVLNGRRGERSC